MTAGEIWVRERTLYSPIDADKPSYVEYPLGQLIYCGDTAKIYCREASGSVGGGGSGILNFIQVARRTTRNGLTKQATDKYVHIALKDWFFAAPTVPPSAWVPRIIVY